MKFSPSIEDEQTLCSGSRDTSVRLWDVKTGDCQSSVKAPRNLVTCLQYLPPSSGGPTSSSAVVIQAGEDLKLRVWDFREGRQMPTLILEGYKFFPVSIVLCHCLFC